MIRRNPLASAGLVSGLVAGGFDLSRFLRAMLAIIAILFGGLTVAPAQAHAASLPFLDDMENAASGN